MKKSTSILFKIGAIAYLIVGAGHIAGHFTLPTVDPKAIDFLSQLENFKYDLFGPHDLLDNYNGYSLMMGSMLLFFGLLCLLIASNVSVLANRKIMLTVCLGALSTFTLALIYFWLIPQIVSSIGLIAFVVAYLQNRNYYLEMNKI